MISDVTHLAFLLMNLFFRNIINRQKFKQEYRYRSHLSYSKYQDVQTEKPFGTYKEFSKMICRGELNMFKNYPNRKQKKLRRIFKPKIDVNAEISGLIKSLDRINLKDAELGAGRDPSEKKKKLAEEMAKVRRIEDMIYFDILFAILFHFIVRWYGFYDNKKIDDNIKY